MARWHGVRTLGMVVGLAVGMVAVGCSETQPDDEAAVSTSSTPAPAEVTSTVPPAATPSEPSPPATTPTGDTPSGGPDPTAVVVGSVTLRTDDGLTRRIQVRTCESGDERSLEIDGSDEAGNEFQLKAADGSGAFTLRGADLDHEGSVDELEVDGGTIAVSGRLAPVDGGAVGGYELEGTCRG